MKSITIDFTKSPIEISDTVLGHKGEKNATQLIITPPAEMSAPDSGIVYYCVAFQIGAHRVSHSALYEKAETITVPLERSVTQVNVLSLQLEGYDGEENVIIKSDRIDNLTFDLSVDGEEYDGSEETNLGAEVAAMKNKLNKFGEDADGNLLYKNNPLTAKERSTFSIELPYDDGNNFYVTSNGNNLYALSDTSDTFKEGTEIASLEMWVEDYNGSRWVDFRDMAEYDGSPFILNHYKVRSSFELFSGEVIFCLIYCPENTPALLDRLIDGNISKLRITMYME